MEFIDEKLAAYSEAHTSPESPILAELNRETWAKVMMPRMLSGHIQGRLLSMFSKMIRPKEILEIGTYTGYSALCLAEGLADGGVLHTIDINEELEDMVRKYIRQAGLEENIRFHIGNAMDIIPELNTRFDLVFIDADKENYSNYFDLVIDRMHTGGYIIADNVLWSGKVVDPNEVSRDEETKALHAFNEKIQKDSRVENILLPVRDGLMVIRVK
ncbi:MAG: O-methyltransferase [Bacteroidota bacterium]|nr:O-methyltransferase [Bacteroidota bacterium]MDX5429778.1 O-methyltransferase [Bacteroidota bacterium]MDX5468557.1 O-methyltransferase [Bacteroidota bacterium]